MTLEDFKDKFGGKWKQEKSENFEEYFKLMDVNIVVRKLLTNINPSEEYKIDGEYVIAISSMGPMSKEKKFKLNDEYEDDRAGHKMKSISRYEDGKLINESKTDDNPEFKPQTVTVEKISDDNILMTIVVGDNDLVCKRYFKRVSE